MKNIYNDPRDEAPLDRHEVLTEDSDDAIADLEKEYAVKKQKLMEERARKKERGKTSVQVERSPSPPKTAAGDKSSIISSELNTSIKTQSNPTSGPLFSSKLPGTFQRAPKVSTDRFATRFFNTESEALNVNYNERIFEFENIPKKGSVNLTEANTKDEVSGEVLRRRYLEVKDLRRLLQNVKVLRVAKLLAKIIPPKYEEPTYPNWCFVGLIAHKSEPKTASNGKKYMALRIGNFSHTVDLFLFGDAFQKFWKLSCGDVIAVLNPTVKKYGQGFNLSLLDGIDNILEIGSLKFYGHCSASNKQGEACKFVVDLLKNDLCSFHEEKKFKQGSRMELQGSVKPKAPIDKMGQRSQAFVNSSTSQPLFVQYLNAGFLEKDAVYKGGEQFNEAKYDRPVKGTNVPNLRKRQANEKLRLQLLKNAPPSRLNDLDKLGIVPQNELEIIKRQNSLLKIKLQAFKNTFLTGMGYDPTFDKSQRLDRVQPTQSMEELRSISKSKKVSLKPSEEEQKKRLQKQKVAMGIIRSKGSVASNNVIPQQTQRCNARTQYSQFNANDQADPKEEPSSNPCEFGSDFGSADSAESDLEISFSRAEDQLRYKKAISTSVAEP